MTPDDSRVDRRRKRRLRTRVTFLLYLLLAAAIPLSVLLFRAL